MGSLAETIAKLMSSRTAQNVAQKTAEYEKAKQARDDAPKVLHPGILNRLQMEYEQAQKAMIDAQKDHAKELQERTRQLRNGAIAGGLLGVGVAASMRNDTSGMQTIGAGFSVLGKGASVAGSALMMLGPVGMAVGGVLKAFGMIASVVGVAIQAIDQLSKAILARAEELKKYSPEIAVADAQAKMKLQQADIQEAQSLGPDMARLLEAKTDVDISIREILLPIKKVIFELMADFFEWIRDFLEENKEFLVTMAVTIGEGIKAIIEAIQLHFTEAAEIVAGLPDKIADALKPKPDPADFWKVLKDNAMKDLLPLAPPNPAAPPHRMDIPVFML